MSHWLAGETGRRKDESGREAVVITQPPAPCSGKRVAGRSEEAAVQERALGRFKLGGSPADPGHHLEGPQSCKDNTLE